MNTIARRIAAGIFLIAAPAFIATPAWAASADPFDQASFPCEEDEVLGFAPQFGPDKVGCIRVDSLR
ncbi:membrane protein [Mycobacterium phage Killigrew]|nr:membrane protein [Mycobacterium phage Killigrew]